MSQDDKLDFMPATQTEKVVRFVIKLGLWIVPFLPLYVSSSMLFPFITGKNFAFRIIIEFIFALWSGVAVWKEEYRPRLTPLFKVATVFIIVLFLADLFSPDPYRSFFSNYERMEGFMMLFHFYLYFVVLHSVFRAKDWIVFFHMTLLASIAVSYTGLLQKLGYRVSLQGGFRVDSTIGNPTYLAAYLLFHIWMILLLMYRFWKKWWLVLLYAGALLFELAILYFTASRGPVLALVVILVPFLASIVWFWTRIREEGSPAIGASRKSEPSGGFGPCGGWLLGRKIAAAVLVSAVVVPAFFWQIRGSDFVQSNQALKRLVNYSLTETTIKSRFLIWGMSSHAALERPILGWGQENYYLAFQKYFDPGLFAQEPWFDRSHNIIFDWLIHAGFPGLILYLGMIAVACWALIRGIVRGTVHVWHGIVLVSLFLTYLFQNFFVFDNMNTYLLFFAFLAFADSISHVPEVANGKGNMPRSAPRRRAAPGLLVGAVMLAIVGSALYPFHIKPIRESKALIRALNLPQQGGTLPQIQKAFEEALSYNTFGDAEVREQLSNFSRAVAGNSSLPAEERKAFVEFTINELKKETAGKTKDVKHLLFLGTILLEWASVDPLRAAEAEEVLKEAVKLSPTKQIVYFPLAQLYLSRGNGPAALDLLYKAWTLDKNYHEAGANLLMVSLLVGNREMAEEAKKGVSIIHLNQEVLGRLGGFYRQAGDYESVLPVYRQLVVLSPQNAEHRAMYAALLGATGHIAEAISEAEEAIRLDPNLKPQLEAMIESLKQNLPK